MTMKDGILRPEDITPRISKRIVHLLGLGWRIEDFPQPGGSREMTFAVPPKAQKKEGFAKWAMSPLLKGFLTGADYTFQQAIKAWGG